MLAELHGKYVVVHLGVVAGFTDTVKGEVVATDDQWIQVRGRKGLEFIPLAAVKRITLAG